MDRHAEERWEKALRQWHTDVAKYNSDLLDYNLQVPLSVGQRVPMNPEQEIEKALKIHPNLVQRQVTVISFTDFGHECFL